MTFPNTKGKHSFDSLFTPAEYVAYIKKIGNFSDLPYLEGVVLIYSKSLLKYIVENEEVEKTEGVIGSDFYVIKKKSKKVGICGGFGIGPSGVSSVMEELIALGCKKFLSIGTAGALQKNLSIGDFVVCNRAIRDEGVSYHYLSDEKYSYPSGVFTEKLKENFKNKNIVFTEGTTWTIDAPYRETIEELKRYQSEGVLTVEMEASALCAVAAYREVEFATAFVISDSLAELIWNPQFHSSEKKESIKKLYEAAIETLFGDKG